MRLHRSSAQSWARSDLQSQQTAAAQMSLGCVSRWQWHITLSLTTGFSLITIIMAESTGVFSLWLFHTSLCECTRAAIRCASSQCYSLFRSSPCSSLRSLLPHLLRKLRITWQTESFREETTNLYPVSLRCSYECLWPSTPVPGWRISQGGYS